MPVKMVTGMALANAVLMNVCLVVLMVPFIVDSMLNDTVDVLVSARLALNQNVEVRLGIVHEQNSAVRKFSHGIGAPRK